MKIGITGATGQLGRIVVQELKEKVPAGNIIALVRSSQKAADLGVETREADYNQPQTLEEAFQGLDTLLLISSSEVGKRAVQHQNVIDAAKKTGVKRIVYTSLLHADTTSISLATEHLATEAALKESGLSYTILRNGWYTENYAGTIPGAVAGGALLGSAGAGKISAASRQDFAEAAVAVLTTEGHEGKVYELAGDEAFTLADLATQISEKAGKEIPYKNLPEGEYAAILTSFGVPEGFAHAIAGWDAGIAKGDLFNDSKQLSGLIGRPTTPVSEVVVEAFKQPS
ncbi:MAG TPA: SDR family oxidoreductase [Chitinophagaceae bacterium]|jgi:NAD(P)H dehydrogenase (quinone)|nr:SDR family oxidoreductase [Chitinophagaceae bacterium]